MIRLLIAAAVTAGVLVLPTTVLAAANKLSDDSDDTTSETAMCPANQVLAGSDEEEEEEDEYDDEDSQDESTSLSTETGDSTIRGNAEKPGDIIDLKNWYLTLPTGTKGKPDTIQPEKLASYTSQYMQLNKEASGVVFTTNSGGTTTKNSKYPRSELREMIDSKNASWDGSSGRHTMEIKQAVTKLPTKKPEVVVGQIHGTSDDLMQIHLSGKQLSVKYDDGQEKVSLDDNYQLGTVFTIKIESSEGRVKVWYNGDMMFDMPISSKTSYFKAGNYIQSNPSKGDSATATSEVVIYALDVRHEQ